VTVRGGGGEKRNTGADGRVRFDLFSECGRTDRTFRRFFEGQLAAAFFR